MLGRLSRLRHTLALPLLALGIAVFGLAPGDAIAKKDRDAVWEVKKKLYGQPDESDPDDITASDKSDDVSGIACATETGFPRICMIADDEAQGAQIVILNDGTLRAGTFIRLTKAMDGKTPLELDAEGVAFADGAFYVIGSHGRPRHAPTDPKAEAGSRIRAEATRHLFRIRFDLDRVDLGTGRIADKAQIDETGKLVEITGTSNLTKFIQEQPALKPFYDRPLELGGLTIEGVAVKGGRLHAGLRGPLLDDGKAAILSVPLTDLFEGKAGAGRLDSVWLGSDSRDKARGVRDLVAMPDGFLILAGPVQDPDDDKVEDGDYTVFRWNGTDAPKRGFDLDGYGKKTKPEALVPLDRDGSRMRILVLFDGPKEGGPRAIEIPW